MEGVFRVDDETRKRLMAMADEQNAGKQRGGYFSPPGGGDFDDDIEDEDDNDEVVYVSPSPAGAGREIIYVQQAPEERKYGCLSVMGVVFCVLIGLWALGCVARIGSRSSSDSTPGSSSSRSSAERTVGSGSSRDSTQDPGLSSGSAERTEAHREALPTPYGESKSYAISIDDAHLESSASGDPYIIVDYTFTNLSDEGGISFAWSAIDKVYQNGIECTEAYFKESEHSDNSTRDIKIGVSVPVTIAYKLNDTTTDVEVNIQRAMLDDTVIASRTFKIADGDGEQQSESVPQETLT